MYQCPVLNIDSQSVAVNTTNLSFRGGDTILVSCKKPGEDFDVGENIRHVTLSCKLFQGWTVSNEAFCPGNSLHCIKPATLSCSMKGCNPLRSPDPGYQITYFGGNKPSLPTSHVNLFCGQDVTRELLLDSDMLFDQTCAQCSLMIEQCPEDEVKVRLRDAGTKKLLSIDALSLFSTIDCEMDFSSEHNGTCFHAEECGNNKISLSFASCFTECLNTTFSVDDVNNATFMFPVRDELRFLVPEHRRLNESLILENWNETEVLEMKSIEMTCSKDTQQWVFPTEIEK